MNLADDPSERRAKSDRDAGRALVKALAKEYGGKPVELSDGFLLNSKLAGCLCQFSVESDWVGAVVFKLRYKSPELRRAEVPGLIIGDDPVSPNWYATPGKKVEVKSASKLLGIKVRRAWGAKAVPEEFIRGFCRDHKDLRPVFMGLPRSTAHL